MPQFGRGVGDRGQANPSRLTDAGWLIRQLGVYWCHCVIWRSVQVEDSGGRVSDCRSCDPVKVAHCLVVGFWEVPGAHDDVAHREAVHPGFEHDQVGCGGARPVPAAVRTGLAGLADGR